LVGTLPAPVERRPVARVAKGLGPRGEIPEGVLGVAEIETRQPRLRPAEPGVKIEKAILERELEARGGPSPRADDEVDGLVLRNGRLRSAEQRLQRIGPGRLFGGGDRRRERENRGERPKRRLHGAIIRG